MVMGKWNGIIITCHLISSHLFDCLTIFAESIVLMIWNYAYIGRGVDKSVNVYPYIEGWTQTLSIQSILYKNRKGNEFQGKARRKQKEFLIYNRFHSDWESATPFFTLSPASIYMKENVIKQTINYVRYDTEQQIQQDEENKGQIDNILRAVDTRTNNRDETVVVVVVEKLVIWSINLRVFLFSFGLI